MKNLIIVIIFIVFCTSFCFMGTMCNQIPQNEQIVNKLMNQTANFLAKKYKIKPVGIRVGMPGGIVKKLGLEFEVIGSFSREEIRKLLINSSNEFLSAINEEKNIYPYLECNPFKKKKSKLYSILKIKII